ncbi:mitochondrial fission ELM1 family protein [Terasakiella pusilla]
MVNTPNIWVLADDRAGNVGQCLGVAEALNWPFERKDIAYNKLAKLPNFLLGARLCGVQALSRDGLQAPWPDLVIAAGRRTAPVARYIKKQSKGRAKLVQIMHPGSAGAEDFDLIFVPDHDAKTVAANEVLMIGAPHRVTDGKLAEAREIWTPRFKELGRPLIALIVGGATKDKEFSTEMAKALGQQVNQLAASLGAGVLLTTSRRTGTAAQAIVDEITVPAFIYQWGDAGENPYFGFLACADYIVVTGDSVSMCSESCAAGKPVSIFAPANMISDKHQRMVTSMVEKGGAGLFNGQELATTPASLNVTQDIAGKIKTLFTVE